MNKIVIAIGIALLPINAGARAEPAPRLDNISQAATPLPRNR